MDFLEQIINVFWPVDTPENYVLSVNAVSDVVTTERKDLVSVEKLLKVMPKLHEQKAKEYCVQLNAAMVEFEINTPLRIAAFLAQIAHESCELQYFEELGRPSYFTKYDGRVDLGNTQPGDGARFKGRGPIQLTGRANYRKAGVTLAIDLENNPEMAADPSVAFRVAGLFWKGHKLNELADKKNFDLITYRINGGYRGLKERKKYYEVALGVFA